ncbi:MAG: tyrosine-type recombinase/integrase [Crocinitomicaceae bacterium]|nr:tyrosine-type recombinase/integrase [Crocinitomicaceae bacterium]
MKKSSYNSFEDYLFSKGYSSSTVHRYANNVDGFKSWIEKENITPETVSHNDLLAYIRNKRTHVQQNTIKVILNAVKLYFDWQLAQGELSKNPATQVTIKGIQRRKLHTILTKPELENLYHQYQFEENEANRQQNWYRSSQLGFIRNKVMIGLLVYQGVTAGELKKLTLKDIDLREGIIKIPGGRKSNERTLTLQSVQMLDLMQYTLKTREEILQLTGKESEKLFTSTGVGSGLQNVLARIPKELQKINPKAQNLKQIRTSVITHWLKSYNLREVQYMAGHRYISSTENYLINDLEGLQEDIIKFHPIG